MADLERERDLVIGPNEYVLVMDTTKGIINVIVGCQKISLSNSDALVVFDERTKRFRITSAAEAIQTFCSVPEGWYTELKNPTRNNEHPRAGAINNLPDLQIGKKINIKGPVSFALFPGQMKKIIQGHKLKSNQYLLARVYDADAVSSEKEEYYTGQLLIIKGTEVPFYIPPTGIEVIPVIKDQYIRNAVTLERLEYCILKGEDGVKQYIHGPAVVFPEPDEDFVKNKDNDSYKFRAIELSEISGIYIKVIAAYVNENEVEHLPGEELFITGKDQMIYYPRPEHAIIDYDGKVLHHAIAIPAGEGRYVLNRLTGNIRMVKGPLMYLPDPRFEVIVNRKLTRRECELWYPGNKEVLDYNVKPEFGNTYISSASLDDFKTTISNCCLTASTSVTAQDNGFYGQANVTTDDSGFKRGNTYSKPRTITFDNKYDGVVSIDIWTGYAINVISKNGNRKVIVGPQTYLLEYDETLEVIKTPEGETVFLRVENNHINDVVSVQTKDFVNVDIDMSYLISFDPAEKDCWFGIEDFTQFLIDYERALIRSTAKQYTIEEFYEKASEIINNAIHHTVEKDAKSPFDNGMFIQSSEVLGVKIVDENISQLLSKHQTMIVRQMLEYSTASKSIGVATELAKIEKSKIELEHQNEMYELDLKNKVAKEKLAKQDEIKRMEEASAKATKEAEKAMQTIEDAIKKSELARQKLEDDQQLAWTKEHDKLEAEKNKAYTDALKKVIDSISPDLVAAMTTSSQANMLRDVAQSLSPYALASGDESVADVVNKLLRGTGLEGVVNLQVKDKE